MAQSFPDRRPKSRLAEPGKPVTLFRLVHILVLRTMKLR